jgi:hypothetical protein
MINVLSLVHIHVWYIETTKVCKNGFVLLNYDWCIILFNKLCTRATEIYGRICVAYKISALFILFVTILSEFDPIQLPKLKSLTKWEQYAKEKSIINRKKGRMTWDDQSKVCQSVFSQSYSNCQTNYCPPF